MNDRSLLDRAIRLHRRGSWDEAARLYWEILERNRPYALGAECVLFLAHLLFSRYLFAPPDAVPSERELALAAQAVREYPCGIEIPTDLRHPTSEWLLRYSLGCLSRRARRWDGAVAAYQAARELDPPTADAATEVQFALGECWHWLGEHQRAREMFDVVAHAGAMGAPRIQAQFFTGNWQQAWLAFECGIAGRRFGYAARQWNGEPLEGRLFLDPEEWGYGDVLMLARWLPLVRVRVGEVVLGCHPELGRLLEGQFDGVSVVTIIEEARPYEAWAWLFSVPPLCQLHRPSDVPPAPYLRATETFRCLPGKFRVGLCWAGTAQHAQDPVRSTALAAWGPVLQVPGVTFYSLQVGPPAEQLGGVDARIQDLSGELTDWSKTAAAMMQLDLVVTVDTAVAHLAGALGVPVWICLPKALEWRWPLEGTETAWYSSARLFRPTPAGDWASVFADVARALAERVNARESTV